MKIILLGLAQRDLIWFRHYYRRVFPEGRRAAADQYHRALAVLSENPKIGKPLAHLDAREYSILRTPFAFIYRLRDDQIEIMRVWDQRADPEQSGFHEEAAIFT